MWGLTAISGKLSVFEHVWVPQQYRLLCPWFLDMPRQLLYWADQRSISRVNFEGRDRKTVVESNGYLDRPFGLAVFEVKKNIHTHSDSQFRGCNQPNPEL